MNRWKLSLNLLLVVTGFYLGKYLFLQIGIPSPYTLLLATISIFLLPFRNYTTPLVVGSLILFINIVEPYSSFLSLKNCSEISGKGIVLESKSYESFTINLFQLDRSRIKGSFISRFSNFTKGDTIKVDGSFSLIDSLPNIVDRDYFISNLLDYNLIKVDQKDVRKISSSGEETIVDFIEGIRSTIRDRINSLYQYDPANFYSGVIIGDRTQFSSDDMELYRKSGSIHLLAVSGLHVGIVLLLLSKLPRKYKHSHRWNSIIISTILILYIGLTGGSLSVIRAVSMIVIYYLSYPLKRVFNSEDIVALSGFLMVIFNPKSILSDSFILSYSAVYAILILYNREKSSKGVISNYIVAPIKISFVIALILGPILLMKYGFYNPLSIIVAPFLLLLTTLSLIFGPLSLLGLPYLEDMFQFYGTIVVDLIVTINQWVVDLELFHINYKSNLLEALLLIAIFIQIFRGKIKWITSTLILTLICVKLIPFKDNTVDIFHFNKGVIISSDESGVVITKGLSKKDIERLGTDRDNYTFIVTKKPKRSMERDYKLFKDSYSIVDGEFLEKIENKILYQNYKIEIFGDSVKLIDNIGEIRKINF